ncbi:hypothetical protein T08_14884 [Trichinella sp. T8]|nr:hypothetical protein T08_14884 [Trichinella sp. T8]
MDLSKKKQPSNVAFPCKRTDGEGKIIFHRNFSFLMNTHRTCCSAIESTDYCVKKFLFFILLTDATFSSRFALLFDRFKNIPNVFIFQCFFDLLASVQETENSTRRHRNHLISIQMSFPIK